MPVKNDGVFTFSPLLIAVEVVTQIVGVRDLTLHPFSPLLIAVEVVTEFEDACDFDDAVLSVRF